MIKWSPVLIIKIYFFAVQSLINVSSLEFYSRYFKEKLLRLRIVENFLLEMDYSY